MKETQLRCLVLQRRDTSGVPWADRRQGHGHLAFLARTQGCAAQTLKLPKGSEFPTEEMTGSWLPWVHQEDTVRWPLVNTKHKQAGAEGSSSTHCYCCPQCKEGLCYNRSHLPPPFVEILAWILRQGSLCCLASSTLPRPQTRQFLLKASD